MIANREIGLAYIHAAKCGGSTIRQQLRTLIKDDFEEKFFYIIDHPEVGKINGNHVPLAILRRYFPDAFERIASVTSYMLCRDPMDRFISSVSQWLRSERGIEPSEASAELVRTSLAEICRDIRRETYKSQKSLVYFIPQVDYAEIDGKRLITRIFTLEDISLLQDELEKHGDIKLLRNSVWNPTVTYRFPAMKNKIHHLKDSARRILPNPVYARTRDVAVKLLTQRGAPSFEKIIREDREVEDFIKDFYGADAELHRSVREDYASNDLIARRSTEKN